MGILIAVIAYTLLGLSIVLDKMLLKERVRGSSIVFIFWIGIANVVLFPFVFFGFSPPTAGIFALGFASGAFLLLAGRFYYGALERGEATKIPTVIGALTPISAALWSLWFLSTTLNIAEWVAFGVLVAGGVVMLLSDEGKDRRTFFWAIGAAFFYGLGNVTQKIVFTETNFTTGMVLYAFGMAVTALALLLRREWHDAIFAQSTAAPYEKRRFYIGNRILAGIASLLIFYAIKLEHPALIDAVSGMRAVVAFLFALLVMKFRPKLLAEHFHGWKLAGKIAGTLIIIIGLSGLGLERYYAQQPLPPASSLEWDVTFSQKMSQHFLDSDVSVSAENQSSDPNGRRSWKNNFSAIVDELKPRGLRLVAYWDLIEPQQNEFAFDDLDWQMRKAMDAQIPVVLAIGQKVPRWPECHLPRWAEEIRSAKSEIRNNDGEANFQKELLEYLAVIVNRYREYPNLLYWQVENEPFLNFGECPPADAAFLEKEIALVKSLDPTHAVLTTDGGEFGRWVGAATRGDVFGTTMYRKVHSDVFGYITYPLTPEFFRLKKSVVQFFTGKPQQEFIVIELGTEPWEKHQLYEIPADRGRSLFSLADFKNTISFARATGFTDYYLWGAEWWYWLKTAQNDSSYWDYARELMTKNQ